MLRGLIELSREASTEKRREILKLVSQLFSDGAESFSDREKLLFGEIFVRLLDQVAVDDRIDVSKKIGHLQEAPREAVLKLAYDVAEVAAPVLELSSVLTDRDLADIAASQGQDHLLAISRRGLLAETVTDVIVRQGDDRVLRSVARNSGARFSQAGFTALAEKGANSQVLAEILAGRTDLPRYVAENLLPMLSEESRNRLHYLLENNRDQVETLLRSTHLQFENSWKILRAERSEVILIKAQIREGKRTLSDALTQLVQERRLADIAHILGELSKVPIGQVANAFHKVDASAIAAVCKCVDVENAVYEQLSVFRCEKLKLPPSKAKQFLREYEALDKATAERVIRFHKVRLAVGH